MKSQHSLHAVCFGSLKRICRGWSLCALFLGAVLLSCSEDSNPEFEKQTFTSVFDHSDFSAEYYPISLKQTPDGGYLILAEREIPKSLFRGSYLLKVDEFGDFERELILNVNANPVGDLMEVDGNYYFFAMDTLTLQAQLLKVDAEAETAEINGAGGVTYPAAASLAGNELLLLSYQHADKQSIVSAHGVSGDIIRGPASFSIGAGDDVDEPIMNHILRTGKRFPFQVGKVSEGLYFFNGFRNYTFSLVFTDMSEDGPEGIIDGQQDDGGVSAILPLESGSFAISRFDFGENYFLPGVKLPTQGQSKSAELGGYVLRELIPDAPVRILRATTGGKDMLVYASDTRSKQIGLFFYDVATSEFISSRYLGFSNPFEIAAMTTTADEGIAICGTTWLAGRFPRICLFKISKEDLLNQAE